MNERGFIPIVRIIWRSKTLQECFRNVDVYKLRHEMRVGLSDLVGIDVLGSLNTVLPVFCAGEVVLRKSTRSGPCAVGVHAELVVTKKDTEKAELTQYSPHEFLTIQYCLPEALSVPQPTIETMWSISRDACGKSAIPPE